MVYAFYSVRPELGWAVDGRRIALSAVCGLYLVSVALRLARFNVLAAKGPHLHYTGTPSTMTAGVLLAFFLMSLKYAAPQQSAPETLDSWRLLGSLRTDVLLPYLPFTLLLGAAGMLSPLRVPRLGRTFSRATDLLLLVAVLFGYSMGIARRLPEYLVGGGLYYLGICIAYHFRTRRRG